MYIGSIITSYRLIHLPQNYSLSKRPTNNWRLSCLQVNNRLNKYFSCLHLYILLMLKNVVFSFYSVWRSIGVIHSKIKYPSLIMIFEIYTLCLKLYSLYRSPCLSHQFLCLYMQATFFIRLTSSSILVYRTSSLLIQKVYH